jgi:hypothetical protein
VKPIGKDTQANAVLSQPPRSCGIGQITFSREPQENVWPRLVEGLDNQGRTAAS